MKDVVAPRDDPQRLLERIRTQAPAAIAASIIDRRELQMQSHQGSAGAIDPLGSPPASDSPGWVDVDVDDLWGHDRDLAQWGFPFDGGEVIWLRSVIDVPESWVGDDVLLRLESRHRAESAAIPIEALVYLDGVELGGFDSEHETIPLPPSAQEHLVSLLIRATVSQRSRFSGIQLERRNRELWEYGNRALVGLGIVDTLADTSAHRHQLIHGLTESWRAVDVRHGWASAGCRASVPRAMEILSASFPRGLSLSPRIVATGHGHLDVAWLWPFWRTRQKAVHTVSTALRLMEVDPTYHFTMSSPQVWKWIKEDAPALWTRMMHFVATGQLEPVGAFWVESDCNLPSGESLIRQMNAGLRFFESELGQSPNAAWLPDSFGFSAVIPQLLRSAGIEVFMTTKLSWNRVNRMPSDTFAWVGLDGTSVIGHFVTTSGEDVPHISDTAWHTYASRMSPAETHGLWAHYLSKDVNDELLLLFGMGDGGGGPTEQMLQHLAVLGSTTALGDVKPGRADAFFDRLQNRVRNDELLQEWVGDLYLEGHLGTYTSQARMKRANRDAEWTLKRTELLAAWAHTLGATSRQAEIDELWETALRHQFHDVLPGSSIPLVYEDVMRESEEMLAAADRISRASLGEILEPGAGSVVVNPLGWARDAVVEHDGRRRLVHVEPFSISSTPAPRESFADASIVADGRSLVLRNGLVEAVIDASGEVSSLTSATGREFIARGGRANRLVLHEDRPVFWDAWDIDPYYQDKSVSLDSLESIRIVSNDPLRVELEVVRVSDGTRIEQRYRLDAGSPRLDIKTTIDWNERSMLLRAYFDWDSNARGARVGRQFGSIEVPRNRNTSWEQARYEFVAHGFVDVSDEGGGVALLTDATYGHSVTRAQVGLTLLKSGTWPDPTADAGIQVLNYSLMPHDEPSDGAALTREAANMAQPLEVLRGLRGHHSLLAVDGDGFVVDTVKSSWSSDAVVLRVVETRNAPTVAILRPQFPVRRATLCDIREGEIRELEIQADGSIALGLRAHEVATVQLEGRASPRSQ
jgi:alpha-mannosidase